MISLPNISRNVNCKLSQEKIDSHWMKCSKMKHYFFFKSVILGNGKCAFNFQIPKLTWVCESSIEYTYLSLLEALSENHEAKIGKYD